MHEAAECIAAECITHTTRSAVEQRGHRSNILTRYSWSPRSLESKGWDRTRERAAFKGQIGWRDCSPNGGGWHWDGWDFVERPTGAGRPTGVEHDTFKPSPSPSSSSSAAAAQAGGGAGARAGGATAAAAAAARGTVRDNDAPNEEGCHGPFGFPKGPLKFLSRPAVRAAWSRGH